MQRKYPSPRPINLAAVSRLPLDGGPGLAAPWASVRARAAEVAGRRDGMVLLFVVVLLTLLAVLGSAYLVTSRVDNGQVSPAARGGPADPFGIDAADRVAQIMTSAQTAAERRLFLDAFAFNGIVPPNPNPALPYYPSAQRVLGDESGDGDINNGAGDGVDDLMYRPTEADRQNAMPVPGAAPTVDELGVFGPMIGFGGFLAGRGMYDAAAPAPDFANTVHFPYYHVDGVGLTDTHLASRLPVLDNFSHLFLTPPGTTPVNEFVWPWISAPLVGLAGFPVDNAFLNPLDGGWVNFDVTGRVGRFMVIPTTYGPVAYPPPPEVLGADGNTAGGTTTDEFYNDRLRVWPGLAVDVDENRSYLDTADRVIVAADADGDGVADSGLVPIVFNPEIAPPWDGTNTPAGIGRYVDPQTGYVYLVGVRIVDNNAAVNVNTALTRFGDVTLFDPVGVDLLAADYETALTTSPPPPGSAVAPNRGLHASNIGLYELFYAGIDAEANTPVGTPGRGIDDAGNGATRNGQFRRLLPDLLGDPTSMAVDNASGLQRADMQYATLGELLSMNRDRLLDYIPPFPSAFPNTANGAANIRPFRAMDDAGAMAFKGAGWIVPEGTPTRIENAAYDSLVISAGNFVPNPELQFSYFPIGNDVGTGQANGEGGGTLRNLWAGLFKTADPDMTDLGAFQTVYGGNLGTRFSAADFPISPRAGLVTHNGVNMAFRPHMLGTQVDLATPNILPLGMPPYVDDGSGVMSRPPVRASVNTAGFAEIWRAYWNVMVEPNYSLAAAGYTGPVPSFVPGQRVQIGPGYNESPAQRMFAPGLFQARSGIGGLAVPTRYQVLTLRAALAAANALDIRDIEDNSPGDPGPDLLWGTADDLLTLPGAARSIPTAADVVLQLDPGAYGAPPAPTPQQFLARAVGSEAQPFITEVMMTFLPAGGLQYLGIELYNPYPFPITLENWHVVGILRGGTGGIAAGGVTNLTGPFPASLNDPLFPANPIVIRPNSFVVLQNTVAPPTVMVDPTATTEGRVYTVLQLPPGSIQSGPAGDINREIMLMRPLQGIAGGPALSEADLLDRFVPADAFNPTGIFPGIVSAPPLTSPNQWRYVRANGISEDANGNSTLDPGEDANGNGILDNIPDPRSWKFVSHGAYNAAPDPGMPHTAGMVPVALTTTGRLGAADLETEVDPGYGVVRSIPWGPVLSGPVTVDDGSTAQQLPLYPYGGFARDGDALGIPFIGAYRIYRDTDNDGVITPLIDELVELVPATLDAFFADSPDAVIAPPTTHVGRFIPQGREDADGDGVLDPLEDFNGNGVLDAPFVPVGAVSDHGFYWAEDLFEYITTLHAPGKDLEPHGDTRYYDATATNPDNALIAFPLAFPTQGSAPSTLFAAAAALRDNEGDGYANGMKLDVATNTWVTPATAAEVIASYRESFLPVEGLINLNTADYGILKTLPLAVGATGNVDVTGRDRISGATFGNPADGLAGMVYLGREAGLGFRPYDSIFRLNGLGREQLPTEESFRQYDVDSDPGTPMVVSRKAAGDWTGVRPSEVLAPLVRPVFTDFLEDEDLNGNGIQDGTEADTNGDGTFGTWYYDQPETTLTPLANFEDDTVQITRISNLTTTRSDSYTVYIVVQAWENFGNAPGGANPPARLVRQQRSSFIVDRSGIMPFNPTTGLPWTAADVNGDLWRSALKVTPVPVE